MLAFSHVVIKIRMEDTPGPGTMNNMSKIKE